MAARALTAAAAAAAACGRVGGRTGSPSLLASCSRGAMSQYSAVAQPEEEHRDVDGRTAAAAMTGAQVEASLNRKNVEELIQGEEHVGTVLPDHETLGAGAGALEGGVEDASWVPDQATGVFVPADADNASHGVTPHAPPGAPATGGTSSSSSVLDQKVFVREEDMEDVERPAMANANAK